MPPRFDLTLNTENLGRILVLAAHPDDETIACAGLLQRAAQSLVVFAVDGAPPHYGFEKKFGSLPKYSEVRFAEASRALNFIPSCSILRLSRSDGIPFPDQHLFLELPEAFDSLLRIARQFSPDYLLSHAFEGGHLDHDACHVLARHAAQALNLQSLEFPLYWKSADGRDVFQQFRERREEEFMLQLSQEENRVKRRMLSEYRSQKTLLSVFRLDPERFRPVLPADCAEPTWRDYPFENRRTPLTTESFLRKIREFSGGHSV
jgi:N-acetylglucosamine malate deacetylase 2